LGTFTNRDQPFFVAFACHPYETNVEEKAAQTQFHQLAYAQSAAIKYL
jgi:hypothetical protein